MTKQAKYILIGVSGLILAIGAVFVAVTLIVGAALISASTETERRGSTADDSRERRESKTNSNGRKGNSDETDAADVEGALAPELVGKWTRSEGSGFVDNTGKTKYRSGADFTYEFSSDGSVSYSMDKKVLTILQCDLAETKSANGKAASDDETLTISLGSMSHHNSNSCDSSENVDETLPAGVVKLKYNLKTEYEATHLCIEEADGEKCYDKSGE